MKKFKKIAYIALILIGIGLLPIIFLNSWAMFRLWQTERVKTPEGLNRWEEMVRKTTTVPVEKNLLETPLWKASLEEDLTTGSNRLFSTGVYTYGMPTNALSVWGAKLSTKLSFYRGLLPSGPREAFSPVPMPTLEFMREVVSKMYNKRSRSEVMTEDVLLQQRLLGRYEVEGSKLSEEQKVASFFIAYTDLGNDPILEEIIKNLKESSYYGVPWNRYIKEYGGGNEEFIMRTGSSHFHNLRIVVQDSTLRAQWYAILEDREKCLFELERTWDLISLKFQGTMVRDFLERMSAEASMFNAIHEIISRNILTEDDLAGIQTRLAQINPIGDLFEGLEEDLVWDEKMIGTPITLSEKRLPWYLTFLVRVSGLIPFNKATYRQVSWKYLDALNPEAQTIYYATLKYAGEGVRGKLNFITRFVLQFIDKIFYRTLWSLSKRDAVILGCALERYYLKEGFYPEKLSAALIPAYLEAMPPGSLGRGSLSYTRTEDGYELTLNRLPGVTDLPPDYSVEVTWKRSRK